MGCIFSLLSNSEVITDDPRMKPFLDILVYGTDKSMSNSEAYKIYRQKVENPYTRKKFIEEMSIRFKPRRIKNKIFYDGICLPMEISDEKKEYKKKKIPPKLRQAVWVKCFGDRITGECQSCKDKISILESSWDASHIVAESKGGETDVDNLVPCCSKCNKHMGVANLIEYREQHYGKLWSKN